MWIKLFAKVNQSKNKFDFSHYPKNSKFFDQINKLVTGKIKDEAKGFPVVEFVGLKSKMYSYIEEDDTRYKKTQ